MLFVLTGNVQTGKTRWLERLVDELQGRGVEVSGVLAPGVWADRRSTPERYPHADANGFEKLGIDNVLLPSGERIVFAQRADIALSEGRYDPESQSGKARLSWHISDEAVERVNGHFAMLHAGKEQNGAHDVEQKTGLLVVDELGRLELERNEGLTEAMAMLEDGPTSTTKHALVVVREALLPCIENRFSRWGNAVNVFPNDESRTFILKETLESH